MDKELARIKQEAPSVIRRLERELGELENTVYAAAREVRALKKTGSGDYADAILDRNGFGGNTAEIYFYRFAPKGSPRPRDPEFQALLDDSERYKTYAEACYQRWVKGIRAVQRIVRRYGSDVEVNGYPLQEYLNLAERHETPNHRVHVKIFVPRQDTLRTLRELIEK